MSKKRLLKRNLIALGIVIIVSVVFLLSQKALEMPYDLFLYLSSFTISVAILMGFLLLYRVVRWGIKPKEYEINGGEKPKTGKRILMFAGKAFICLAIFNFTSFFVYTAMDRYGFAAYKCDSAKCFIDAANKCVPAKYEFADDVGSYSFFAEKTCRLNKKVIGLSGGVDPDIGDSIAGKSARCEYEKGGFDRRWVENLFLGAEKCEGELTEALGNFLMIMLQASEAKN